jgi:formylglycine-generating enzyme
MSTIAMSSTSDMVCIPGGPFRMGSERHYPEDVQGVMVDSFWIDTTRVTNRAFRKFVEATGHVTFAEIAPDANDYPGALPHLLKPGSLVFTPPSQPVELRNFSGWWNIEFGADWRHPSGQKKREPRARRGVRLPRSDL